MSAQSAAGLQQLGKLLPLKFVCKFDPPQIGLVYKLNEKDKKKRLYIIELNDLILVPDSLKIAVRLFQEHPLYLNPQVVDVHKIAKLIDVIHEHLHFEYAQQQEDEDNSQMQHHHLEGEVDEHEQQQQQEINESDFHNQEGFDEISDNEY